MPDFGDGAPIGCNGKIDLLFVISRDSNMEYRQEQLALAFPQFIAAIQSKFADFDYHIMVVTGDDGWGNDVCTEACPTPTCKIGEPCCLLSPQNGDKGEPCCPVPAYPCQDLDLVTQCATASASWRPCLLWGGRSKALPGRRARTPGP